MIKKDILKYLYFIPSIIPDFINNLMLKVIPDITHVRFIVIAADVILDKQKLY